jgi:hypothetical protein
MTGIWTHRHSRDQATTWRAPAPVGAAFCALLLVVSATAQETATEPQPPPATQQPEAPPDRNAPGFIDALGRWLGDSAAKLNSQLKDAREQMGTIQNQANDAAKDAAGAAKDAAGAITSLPNARIVDGRERCEAAQNGAPDCRTAAQAVCRGKGFASGKSLDTASARNCPSRVLLSGRIPSASECPVETFVTRAVCQ